MQPHSTTEITQQIIALNNEDNPFQFTANGSQIIGDWKIADVKWAAVLGAGSINKDYRITVNLDELSHTYSYVEESTDSESNVSVNSDGIGFSSSKTWFIGKKKEVSGSIGLGTLVKWIGKKLSHSYNYKFNTNDIKSPLFAALSQSGWQEK